MADDDENTFTDIFYQSLELLKQIEEQGLIEQYAQSNQFQDAFVEQQLLLGIVDVVGDT